MTWVRDVPFAIGNHTQRIIANIKNAFFRDTLPSTSLFLTPVPVKTVRSLIEEEDPK